MHGFITGRHLIQHGGTIIRGFGIACWLRCVGAAIFASEPTTFLEIACAARHSSARRP